MTAPAGVRPGWPEHPVVHEIDTWVWLDELSRVHGRRVTLGDVPSAAWDAVAPPGVDAVWLMGAWERSPVGAAIARSLPDMAEVYRSALPDVGDDDVVGSAYCVRDYVVDARLGGDEGLAAARRALAGRGVRLVLDLVPNHVAPDHPWVQDHPEFFVTGTAADLAANPGSFTEVHGRVVALGRDPYFAPWRDVLQLDASSPALRAAMAELAVRLTEMCDGLRCDMAMLVLDDVFSRTWGARASGGAAPQGGRGFWPTVIGAAKAVRPDFVFWAEAYWGLEEVLAGQGFDACYDKTFMELLVHRRPVADVRTALAATRGWTPVRFVENHDEERAAAVLGPDEHRAALVCMFTVPGVALLHEGEADGRRVRVPVMLGRRPAETPDLQLRDFVGRLLGALADGMRTGSWALAPVDGWPDNQRNGHLLAWTWTGERRWLVVVNLTGSWADGRVVLPWTDVVGTTLRLVDRLTGVEYRRDGAAVARDGLYVRLGAHGSHLFAVD